MRVKDSDQITVEFAQVDNNVRATAYVKTESGLVVPVGFAQVDVEESQVKSSV